MLSSFEKKRAAFHRHYPDRAEDLKCDSLTVFITTDPHVLLPEASLAGTVTTQEQLALDYQSLYLPLLTADAKI